MNRVGDGLPPGGNPVAPAPAPKTKVEPVSTPEVKKPGTTWAAKGAAKSTGAQVALTPPAPKPDIGTFVDSQVSKLVSAMRGLGTDEQAIFAVLEQNPPALVASIVATYEKTTGRTLRSALPTELSGADLRRGLARLDQLLVKPTDTTGTSGIADKLLELRKQGAVNESELVNHYRPTSNNKIELMIKGENAFPRVMQDVKNAKDHVHVSFYIFTNDAQGNQLADALIEAKKRGVDVRVSMDGIGSQLINPFSGNYNLVEKMEAAGIEVRKNHLVDVTRDDQVLNPPDHRKLVIIDGKVGYTGGMNMADHYKTEYHDVMVRAEGDVVKQMQSEWMTGWLHLGGKVPGDDETFKKRYFPEYAPGEGPGKTTLTAVQGIPGENGGIMQTYLEKIDGARKSIKIENPYCTNPDIQNALIRAAKRGVDVTVILPGQSDHGFSHYAAQQKYPEMINAGIKIYEYPGFNHGKMMTVDEKFVTVGSSNLDDVALYHVYELNLNADDPAFAREMNERIFEKDIKISKQMKTSDITPMDRAIGKFWNLFHHFI